MTKLTLTNHNIAMACREMELFFGRSHVEKRDVLRTCLAVEEVLLGYQEAFGTVGSFQYECGKRMGRIYAKFFVPGERRDVVLNRILSGMGNIPVWQYKNGINHITFPVKKKKASPAVSLAVSVALALFCEIGRASCRERV